MKAIDEINAMVKAAGRYDDPMRVKERLARVQKRVGPARSYFAGLGASDPELRFGQTSKRPSATAPKTSARTGVKTPVVAGGAGSAPKAGAGYGIYGSQKAYESSPLYKMMQGNRSSYGGYADVTGKNGKVVTAKRQYENSFQRPAAARRGAYAGYGTPASSGNSQLAGRRFTPNLSGRSGSLNEYGGPSNMGVAGTHTCPTCRGSGRTA